MKNLDEEQTTASHQSIHAKIERQKLILDYIRTIVIVVGVILALSELRGVIDDRQKQKFQITSTFLSRLGDEDMVRATGALSAVNSLEATPQNFRKIMVDLTPIRQLYVGWAACLAEEICLRGASRQIFCDRMRTYESAVEEIHANFGKSYPKRIRDSQLFGQREACDRDFDLPQL